MSNILISMILSFCPGHDTDSKGHTLTTQCQERMINCMINKAGNNEPSKKEFTSCSDELRIKYGSSNKISASSLQD